MTLPSPNPILPFLRHQGVMILDGGVATTLEERGCDLNDELWSAKVLLEDPEVIRQVSLEFLQAGADCIASVSYQATLEGFGRRGLTREEAVALLERSVALAVEARDSFWSEPGNRPGRLKPLVVGSIGPYGAFLADGSEYRGEYGLAVEALADFHRPRWEILAAGPADLLACETIPDINETRALLKLLSQTPGRWAWMSFSCRDAQHLSDGTPLAEAAALCDKEKGVAGVGVNCVPPEGVSALVAEVGKGTNKPILAYPNSGEVYDAGEKVWRSSPTREIWEDEPARWVAGGCSAVGGCCRVGPETIRGLRGLLAAGRGPGLRRQF